MPFAPRRVRHRKARPSVVPSQFPSLVVQHPVTVGESVTHRLRFGALWILARALVPVAVLSATVAAQGRFISGRVTDQATGQPIASAEVTVPGTVVGTHTKDDGTF